MMHTMNIENGAEVELNHDLNHMLHGLMLCFEFRTKQESFPRSFLLPMHYDELVPFLFDVSLTKSIHHAFRITQVCKGQTYLSGYDFYLVDSEDHQTNITPEFIEAVSRFNDVMKKEDEEDGQHCH